MKALDQGLCVGIDCDEVQVRMAVTAEKISQAKDVTVIPSAR